MIVTGLYCRGPWVFIRINSTGKTGYIPRIICSLYENQIIKTPQSTREITTLKHMRKTPMKHENSLFYSTKQQQQINRYLSHSSAIINNDCKIKQKPCLFDERERRHTYTLPRLHRSNLSSKDNRFTYNTIDCSLTKTNSIIPTRDSDSSSTQDSGYSDSTPFFLVQQTTPDDEQSPSTNSTQVNKKQTHILSLLLFYFRKIVNVHLYLKCLR